MKSSFPAAMASMLKWEGGYSNHPKDPGGATMQGVIQRVYDAYRHSKGLSARDVKLLQASERDEIYRIQYWDAVKGDQLPPGVDLAVFDYAVNSGPGRAIRALQRVLKVQVDGIIGLVTLSAAAKINPALLVDLVCDDRAEFVRGLSTYPTFGKGWENRIRDTRATARKLAQGGQVSPPPPDIPETPAPPPAAKSGGLWAWMKRIFGFAT
jgi:lysozyme family protein